MSSGRRYFINLFTEETWRESRVNARFQYTGHTVKLRNRDEIKPGDTFLCWVTRVSACVAAYEVLSHAYEVEHEDPPTVERRLNPARETAVVPFVVGMMLAGLARFARS